MAKKRLGSHTLEHLESRVVLAVEPLEIAGVVFDAPAMTRLVSDVEQIQASTLVDLNHDGQLDIVFSRFESKTLSVRLALGNNSYEAAQLVSVPDVPRLIQHCDLNGDENQDVLIVTDTQTISVLSTQSANGK